MLSDECSSWDQLGIALALFLLRKISPIKSIIIELATAENVAADRQFSNRRSPLYTEFAKAFSVHCNFVDYVLTRMSQQHRPYQGPDQRP